MSSGKQFRVLKANYSKDTQYSIGIAYRLLSTGGLITAGLFLLSLGLTSCGKNPSPYRPPTVAFHASPPPLASVMPTSTSQPIETPLPLANPSCTDNLTFLEDITIPGGTVVAPGDRVDKRWLVQNSGSCNWDDRYRLRFVSGSELNAPIEQALYPARSGTKASIRVQFTAPSEPGAYQSAWQAYDPQGQPFGDLVYIQIMVDSGMP